ncbi:PQQ-binding-like beta-propeller repeat protein [Nocardioides dongxiaopingii]|uniref:outer membrane protein assembly factor BamB family protein n=1 Tax=Nocardioides sp. S-1144 TaxID=2582905 RepID=UPI00116335AC|nr:PQQ-binding-like beta-propeller repeat protein [Nocardioides sp. S-1144]QCW50700.2 PQQ-binding-like beta-propeller repeat protein [Nocardioides sp. S-1144]
MHRTRLVTLALALVLVVATGCSGADDEDPGTQPPTEEAPVVAALETAWTAPSIGQHDVVTVVANDDGVAAALDDGVVKIDPATGDRTWRVPARGVCTAREAGDGSIVLTYSDRGPNTPCRWVGVVDPVAGAWRWRTRMPEPMDDIPERAEAALQVGDTTVTVITACCYSVALRYDLRTGRELRTVDPDVTGWGAWVVSDGQLIATTSGLDRHSRVRLTMRDADSGRRLWSRTVVELVEENVASAIVSADPLVLATSERGHQLMWRLDERTGEPLTPIGPQSIDHSLFATRSLGVHDGAVVVARGFQSPLATGSGGLAAYDVETGAERWSGFPAGGGFVGFDTEDRPVVLSGGGLTSTGALVTRHSMDDVEDYDVLGTVETSAFAFATVVDDLVVVATGAGLVAHRLPDEGQDVEVDLPSSTWDQQLLAGQQADESRWEDDDVRPGAIDTCHPSRTTLRAFGLHRLDLPAQAGCRWFERQEPLGVTRDLEVGYRILSPPADSGMTAVEAAQADVEQAREKRPYGAGPVDPPRHRPVRGLGDEAYASVLTGPGAYGEVHLLVRVRNVVVEVSARGEADATDVRGASVPGYVLEDTAVAAATDVLAQAGLDLDVDPLPAPDPGAVTRARPVCRALAAEARAVVEPTRGLDQRAPVDPERRTAGCYWGVGDGAIVVDDGERQYSRYAKVGVHAVRGSALSGRTGEQLAEDVFTDLRAGHSFYYEKPRPLDDVGDQALLFPALGWSEEAKVVARVGNVVVQVTVNDQADEDLAARNEAAAALARAALAPYR